MTTAAWSLSALITGLVLDLLFGDPRGFPHIVRWMGTMIAALEKHLSRTVAGGVRLVLIIVLCFTGIPFIILFLCYQFAAPAGYVLESFLCWQLLAVKSLKAESMKVYYSLTKNDIDGARRNVSMIVGRDTTGLDREGIIRAAVETVAENASDGVTAPLFYMMLGGAPLGCLYKAVNTMDSMVGYKNDIYINFGRAAAKLDDILNYIPSRLCAWLMIGAAFVLRLDGRGALRVWRRDRRKHASPNAAQTESVCAGALGVQLAGPIAYHGKLVPKPYIGDDMRPICAEDIINANRLMAAASIFMSVLTILFRLLMLGVMFHATL